MGLAVLCFLGLGKGGEAVALTSNSVSWICRWSYRRENLAWWKMFQGHMLPDKKQEDFQVFLRWEERRGIPSLQLELGVTGWLILREF